MVHREVIRRPYWCKLVRELDAIPGKQIHGDMITYDVIRRADALVCITLRGSERIWVISVATELEIALWKDKRMVGTLFVQIARLRLECRW